MHQFRGKSRQANGNILGTLRRRRAVPDPLAAGCHNGLTRSDFIRSRPCVDPQHSPQYKSIFVKIRGLPLLYPAFRTFHPRNAQHRSLRVNLSDEFFDLLRLAALRLKNGRGLD